MINTIYVTFVPKHERWYAWATHKGQGPSAWDGDRLTAISKLVDVLNQQKFPLARRVVINTDASKL